MLFEPFRITLDHPSQLSGPHLFLIRTPKCAGPRGPCSPFPSTTPTAHLHLLAWPGLSSPWDSPSSLLPLYHFRSCPPALTSPPGLTSVQVASFETVSKNKRAYASANLVEYDEHDPVRGKAVIQPHGT